ncbi:MAG TPA: carbohydrate ABC transporter permease, partial [Usitatibacteraceae bacterium]|nr:carbohydrate ABC transporter permease [Usitatibacteraceae bacterium]
MSNLFTARRLRWFAAAIVLLNGFFPALWILATSFKAEVELTAKPITWFPRDPTLANFMSAFRDQPLPSYLLNSVIVALSSMAVSLFIASLAAYAIARLNLKYRGAVLTSIIAVSMFPLVTLMVPLFEIMRGLNLLNSYWALVLP